MEESKSMGFEFWLGFSLWLGFFPFAFALALAFGVNLIEKLGGFPLLYLSGDRVEEDGGRLYFTSLQAR